MIKNYLIVSFLSFIVAIFFFVLYNQHIIIYMPQQKTIQSPARAQHYKKEITLHFFHHDKWVCEKQELLWSDSVTTNSYQLINAWLAILDEERITTKKVTLQAALLSTDKTLYLSFDHNPLSKEETIVKKWMLCEGLLKTIRENSLAVHSVQFLVQHQPLVDYHLDFSSPWLIQGFMC